MKTIVQKLRLSPFALSVLPGLVFMACFQWLSSNNPIGSRRFTLFDDAMISMDYGRTFAETGEFVWFPGAPRVQGFTNPLWTLWMSAIHLVGFDGSNAALMVSLTGIVLIIGIARVVYTIILDAMPSMSPWLIATASGSVAFLFPTTYWTLRGMEVGLLSFFTLLLIRGVLRNRVSSAALKKRTIWIPALLGIATRFDFLVFCIVALIAMTWWAEPKNRRNIATQHGAFFLFCAVAVCAIQRLYWGTWFPNTYHLKMDGVDAFERISRGFFSGMKALPIIILLLASLLIIRKSASLVRNTVYLCVAMCSIMAAYATYIGGDAWEDQMLNRFYATILPIVPIVILLSFGHLKKVRDALALGLFVLGGSVGLGVSVNPIDITPQKVLAGLSIALLFSVGILLLTLMKSVFAQQAIAVGALVCAVLFSGAYPVVQQIRKNDFLSSRTNLYVTETVETLQTVLKKDAVVATVWAGVPAYYLRQPMFDLLGKNDTRIAASAPHGEFFPGHNKWDYDYGIGEVRPDVVFQTFTRGIDENLDSRILDWGYTKKCSTEGTFPRDGIYFLTNSSNINWNKLTNCQQ